MRKIISMLMITVFFVFFPASNIIAGDQDRYFNKNVINRDADDDGDLDFGMGGTDRDMDNDGIDDFDKGGPDRHVKVK